MVDARSKVAVVAGPSHVVRWRGHVRDRVVEAPMAWDRYIGQGGAPIWHASLLRQVSTAVGTEGDVAVLVGDFRFGNSILLENPVPSATMIDGFVGIAARAMDLEQDRAMLDRGIAGIRAWHETFGDRALYVFWDVFARQVEDRLAGRHISDGRYRDPVLNYAEIAETFPELRIVDLAPLFHLPMHEVQRLFIDVNHHPSHIGYLLLNGLIFDHLDPLEAYKRAVATVETELMDIARGLSRSAGRKVLLTGRSMWLETFSRYMGATGAQRLAEAGLILAPFDYVAGQPTPTQMATNFDVSQCAVAVVSAGGADLVAYLASAFGTGEARWKDAPVIDWEHATEPVIRERGETPDFTRLNAKVPPSDDATIPLLDASQVELGRSGMPSWTGITGLLEYVARLGWNGSRQGKHQWKIENEVLITRRGFAFLVGGNHQPLKFASGQLRPSTASLQAFSKNIKNRGQHAEARGIKYAHVIFPDKQSILEDEFPFEQVVRLGESYVNHISEDAVDHVIYPATDLQVIVGACMPLDSHLSDTGSLAVLRQMLDAVGVDAPSALKTIEQRIVSPRRWTGDLGGKLNPPLFQEVLTLDPDWGLTEITSPGGFNDGMIDILLSPEAPVNKTVLLFGDSFFRMMLKHLSGVFKRVICLRTRFFHREMVELIEPDIVFTGNAERYLAHVDSDHEADSFMLYRPLRGVAEQFDAEFLLAWRSVTAPRAEQSISYFKIHGVGSGRRVTDE